MKKTNILFILWGILVIAIIVLLTILGFIYKKIGNDYQKLENKLLESGETYSTTTFAYPEDNSELIITRDELIESGYLDELKIDNDECNGYVVVTKDFVYKYKPYIKCQKYTTEGYNEKKLK